MCLILACLPKKKIVTLDSDTLFLEYPDEIIKWMAQINNEIFYTYDYAPVMPSINGIRLCCLEQVPFKFVGNLNGGFVGWYKEIFSLDLIESYCRFVVENCDKGINRLFVQGIYAMCIKRSNYSPKMLPFNYQNRPHFRNNAAFRHYWYRGKDKDYFEDVRKVLSELQN
jgi:hypothetical protein